jgi:hypothetical protein
VSSSQITVNWGASSDNVAVTAYDVYRNGGLVGSVSGSTLSYTDTTGLLPSTLYAYYIVARDAAGNPSLASNTMSATTPAATGITLSVNGYKARGVQQADLSWTGASSTNVDIFRNGGKVTTTANDGAYTDNIGAKGGGNYRYKICEAGTTTCSNEVTITF